MFSVVTVGAKRFQIRRQFHTHSVIIDVMDMQETTQPTSLARMPRQIKSDSTSLRPCRRIQIRLVPFTPTSFALLSASLIHSVERRVLVWTGETTVLGA